MTHAVARRARGAAPRPGSPVARRSASRPQAGLPAYMRSGLNVVSPNSAAEKEAESVARTVAAGGAAFGAGRAPGAPLARAPQLPAKPEEKKKPAEPVKKAGKTPEPDKKKDAPVKKAGPMTVDPEKKQEPKPSAPVKRATQAPDPLADRDKTAIKRAVEKAPGAEGVEDKMKMPVARLARAEAEPAAQDDEPVALKRAAEAEAETTEQDPAIALAEAAASPGRPLTPPTRALLESRLGADVGHVRVHDDQAAHDAAESVDARAYTQGADVYLGRGESEGDVELIAHEVTHVLQNDAAPAGLAGAEGGGAESGVAPGEGAVATIARKGKVPPPSKEEGKYIPPAPGLKGDAREKMLKDYTPPTDDAGNGWQGDVFRAPGFGELDVKGRKVTLDKIKVPPFKKALMPAGPYSRPRGLRDSDQSAAWMSGLAKEVTAETSPLPTAIAKALTAPPGKAVDDGDGNPTYFGKGPSGADGGVFVGTGKQIAPGLFRPRWGSSGGERSFDVDHKLETQLGGSDDIGNFWLLDSKVNQTAGPMIMQEIRVRVGGLLLAASRAAPPAAVPEANKVLRPVRAKEDAKDAGRRAVLDWPIEIKEAEAGPGPENPPRWEKDDIVAGKPAEHLKPLNPRSNEFRSLIGDKAKKRYTLMTQLYGGAAIPLTVGKKGEVESLSKLRVFGVKFDGLAINDDMGGTLMATIWAGSKGMKAKSQPLTVEPRPELGYGGAINSDALKAQVYEAFGMSGVKFSSLTIGEFGLEGRGVLEPSLDLLEGIPIDIIAKGGKVSASVTLDAGTFTLPKPFVVEAASVTLGFRDDRLFAEGNLAFLVEKFGKGEVKVGIDTKGGFEAEGKFEVDPKLVSSCTIKAWYREGSFGGEGDAKIDGKKLKGVKEASLHVLFDKEKFEASGALKPDLPGVTEASVSVSYDRAKDLLTVGGKVTLGALPGISGGSIDVTATQKDDGWAIKGSGSLTPDIPGVETTIGVVYDDGLFTADTTVKFSKGKLDGKAHLVVSNAEIVDGKPGKEKTDEISFWGDGSAGLQITPWLKGTASLVFNPDGTYEISAGIKSEKAVELLKPAKTLNEDYGKSVKITLAGIPRAGLYARIGGGLTLSASLGPVLLDDVDVHVDFAKSGGDLSITGVSGSAMLKIPAQASAEFYLRIALGAEVAIAYAEGSLKGSITPSLKGGVSNTLTVNWTPQAGLSIDTKARATLKPEVTFKLTGGLDVGLDLFLGTVSLYSESWTLGSFTMGSDMEFGIEASASYKETDGFKLGEIKPILPDLDVGSIGKKAIDAVL